MTVTYTESEDCIIDNLVQIENYNATISNSTSSILTSLTNLHSEIIDAYNFKTKNELNKKVQNEIQLNEHPEYINSIKREEIYCGFFDSLNTQLNLVFLTIFVIYLFVALCLICIYCKYKGMRGEYERLSSEIEESHNKENHEAAVVIEMEHTSRNRNSNNN